MNGFSHNSVSVWAFLCIFSSVCHSSHCSQWIFLFFLASLSSDGWSRLIARRSHQLKSNQGSVLSPQARTSHKDMLYALSDSGDVVGFFFFFKTGLNGPNPKLLDCCCWWNSHFWCSKFLCKACPIGSVLHQPEGTYGEWRSFLTSAIKSSTWHIESFSETERRQLTSEHQIKMQINIVRGVLGWWAIWLIRLIYKLPSRLTDRQGREKENGFGLAGFQGHFAVLQNVVLVRKRMTEGVRERQGKRSIGRTFLPESKSKRNLNLFFFFNSKIWSCDGVEMYDMELRCIECSSEE